MAGSIATIRMRSGGLDVPLRDRIAGALRDVNVPALTEGHIFPGAGPRNICNRGLRCMGVQLELPRALRDALAHDAQCFNRFVQAVRSAVELA